MKYCKPADNRLIEVIECMDDNRLLTLVLRDNVIHYLYEGKFLVSLRRARVGSQTHQKLTFVQL